MIKNERQYAITRAQADRFAQALARLTGGPSTGASVHPMLRRAEEEALRSQLADLQTELAEYEALRSGAPTDLPLHSLDDLPRVLIQARIAERLSQKDLAERLGLKEQQIQRYEATDYASASLRRLRQVMRALGIQIHEGRWRVTGPEPKTKGTS